MSGGKLATQMDRPYAQQPETRAAAARVISQQPDAEELLLMLGLVEDPVADARNRAKALDDMRGKRTPQGRRLCPSCGKPLPDPIANGGNKPCRRSACVQARRDQAS